MNESRLETKFINYEKSAVAENFRTLGEEEASKRPNAGNPIIPGYIGDPFMFVDDDGTAYIYGTTDGYGKGSVGDLSSGPYAVWYSKDYVNWKSKTFLYEDQTFPKKADKLWAPSVTRSGDKYLMAYIYNGYDCYLAEADSPLGPWWPLNNGNPLTEKMFDSDIITLDSGTYILTMGPQSNGRNTVYIATLNEELTGLKTFEDGSLLKKLYNDNVFEAPGLFERDGKYYITYSNGSLSDGSYHVQYAMAEDLFGPYTYKGYVIRRNDAVGINTTGHNSVAKIDGEYYLTYHYKTQAGEYSRLAGLEKLSFNEDKTIIEVKPSIEGNRPKRKMTIIEPNLASGVDVQVSSVGNTAALGASNWIGKYATDNNNGTLWQAKTLGEEWITVDLGSIQSVGRLETFFEYFTVAYRYKVEYSTDGISWSTMSDRMSNTNIASPHVDSAGEQVLTRYIRLTFKAGGVYVGRYVPVGIFEIKVYAEVQVRN